MNQNGLDVCEHLGDGYQTLVSYGEWRVAILRHIDDLLPEKITYFERHCETDEVFVVLEGRAALLLAGNAHALGEITPCELIPGKLYNVKRDVWHSILLSHDASVLIVENRDTCEGNSQYALLSPEQSRRVIELGQAGQFQAVC